MVFLGLGLAGARAATAPFEVVQSGFATLRQGEFGSAGQNLYVSKSGRMQFIQRWDLNNDGTYDFVFNNTHNRNERPDAFIYLQTNGGYHSIISPLHDLLPLYEQWSQQEKSRDRLLRLPAVGPGAVLIRDLNGDGYPEVVLANQTNGFDNLNSISYVYWGSPQGYQKRTELPTATATDVCIGDLNRDGYADIVFSNKRNAPPAGPYDPNHFESYIYWGSQAGFSVEHRTSISTQPAVSCAMGDLDGDGCPDLVFAESSAGQERLTVYWGAPGGPDLAQPTSLKIPGLRRVRIQELKPFGVTLIAVAEKGVLVYQSGRDRKIQLAMQASTGGWAVTAADLDGDGHDELVIAAGKNAKILWSRAQFSAERATELPGNSPRAIAIADLNQDGRLDIILANNHSDQTYDVPSTIYWGNAWGYGVHHRQDLQTFGASSVAVGDTNHDGKPDVLFGNTVSAYMDGADHREDSLVYWGLPHRGYSPSFVTRYPTNSAMGSAMADLDDDGNPELLLANMDDTSLIHRGTPTGPTVHEPARITFPGSNPHNSFAVADLNRDGYLDVMLSGWVKGDAGGGVVMLWGGPAGISSGNSTKISYELRGVANIRLADLNNDGWLDLFLAAGYDARSAILWGGPEGFSLQRATYLDEPNIGDVEFADLDQDGMLDLVLLKCFDPREYNIRNGSRVRLRFGSAHGFLERPPIELPVIGALDLLVADLNHDGKLDLAVAQYSGGTHSDLPFLIFWNPGQGRFSPENRTELPGAGGTGLLAADFDEDGFIDLLAVNHNDSGNHNVVSHVYWGSPGGFSAKESTALPAAGPHWTQQVDIGNLSTRKMEEYYSSVAIAVPAGVGRLRISLQAVTPHETSLEVQVRSAADRNQLERHSWKPAKDGLCDLAMGDKWLQYRVIFHAGKGGATPLLTAVVIRQAE